MDKEKIQKTVEMLDLAIDTDMLPQGKDKSDEEAIALLQ